MTTKLKLLETWVMEVCIGFDLPADVFLKLQTDEDRYENWDKETLAGKLAKLKAVRKVEYNGHFGNTIFVWIEGDCYNGETMQQVSDAIRQHVKCWE